MFDGLTRLFNIAFSTLNFCRVLPLWFNRMFRQIEMYIIRCLRCVLASRCLL